jgi:hypothetical protein
MEQEAYWQYGAITEAATYLISMRRGLILQAKRVGLRMVLLSALHQVRKFCLSWCLMETVVQLLYGRTRATTIMIIFMLRESIRTAMFSGKQTALQYVRSMGIRNFRNLWPMEEAER